MSNDEVRKYGKTSVELREDMLVFRQIDKSRESEVSLSPAAVRALNLSLEPDWEPTQSATATEDDALLSVHGTESRLRESPSAGPTQIILLPTDQLRALFEEGLRIAQ